MVSIENLIVKSNNATINRKISWYKHDTRDNDFYSKIPNDLLLNIWSWEDPENGDEGFSFCIRKNEENGVIDVITCSIGSRYYDDAYNLFQSAKRSALNIDELILSVDKFLDS